MRGISKGLLVLTTWAVLATSAAVPSSAWQSRVSKELADIYTAQLNTQAQRSIPLSGNTTVHSRARFDIGGRVQVDVRLDCSTSIPLRELRAAGLVVGTALKVPPMCVVEGWVAPTNLHAVAQIESVKRIDLPHYSSKKNPRPRSNAARGAPQSRLEPREQPQGVGSTIDAEGIALMRADQYIQQTSVNGTGVPIAVISDDVTSLTTIQARGELPAVQVVPPSANPMPHQNSTDEGTMMLEEVYAVAPGATLYFCGPESSVEYVGCLQNLVASGVTLITDDVAYDDEDLLSAESDLAMATQAVLAANPAVALFTASENYNGSYWQGAYTPVSTMAQFNQASFTCPASGQVDYYVNSFGGAGGELLTIDTAGTYPVTFQWADPYGQNVSNFDVYAINLSTLATACVSAAQSSDTYVGPVETFAAGQYAIYIATPDQSLAGKYLKLWAGGDGSSALSPYTSGSIVSPQAFVPGVNTVGAVIGSDGVGGTIESYSGQGPIQLIFPSPVQLQAPSFVAPDAIYVDLTGTLFQSGWPDGFFHGTSAASPNAASVAALLRSAFPALTPAQLTSALQNGAAPLASPVPDNTFGYGRVDALGALSTIPSPSLSSWPNGAVTGGSSTASAPLTVGGFGSLHFSVQSSNPSLIPATLVPQGTAGVTLTPANCGVGITCMISAKPLAGQIGSATITLIAKDGANRTASTASTITVTVPPAPTVSVTGGGSQSVVANSAIAPILFSVTGTRPLTVVSSTSTGSAVTVSTGCGTTSSSCSVQVAPVATVGAMMVSLTAQDDYGQSSTSTATVTIKPPAAPTIAIRSGGTQTVNVNMPIAPVAFTLTGAAQLTVTPRTNGIDAVSFSSGCGTTTMSCTANLGNALSTAGTATLQIVVNDNYGQTAQATATIKEVSSTASGGGGGGGSMTFLGLAPLFVLTVLRALSAARFAIDERGNIG